MRFSLEFNFTDFGLFRFRGKIFRDFGFQALLLGIISCTVLESSKNGGHMVVFVFQNHVLVEHR